MLASLSAPVQIPAAPVPIQLTANVTRKTAEDVLSAWAPASLWMTWKKHWTPGFRLA